MNTKVMIVDDEECIRDTLKWYLEDLGYEVVAAPAAESCDVYKGHLCSQSEPCGNALIVDYHMPGMTGLEFIERLQERGCKGVVGNMLILSGNTKGIDRARVKAAGCGLLQKPVHFSVIADWLKGVRQRVQDRQLDSTATKTKATV